MVLTRAGWPAIGGVAVVVGGLLWAVKGAGLMTVGWEPPHAFELAMSLFPFGSVALHHRLPAPRPRIAVAGLVVAWLAVAAALVALTGLLFGPEQWVPTRDAITPLTPFLTLAPLGAAVSLLLVGVVVRRSGVLPGRWRLYPLVLGVAMYPLLAVSGVLEDTVKPLFELPTFLVGCAWVVLGVVLLRSSRGSPSPAGSPPPPDNRE